MQGKKISQNLLRHLLSLLQCLMKVTITHKDPLVSDVAIVEIVGTVQVC